MRNPSLAEDNTEKGERIAKLIARAGICSRRDAEKLNDLFEMLETRAHLTFGVGPVSVPLPDALSAQTHGMLYMWSGW